MINLSRSQQKSVAQKLSNSRLLLRGMRPARFELCNRCYTSILPLKNSVFVLHTGKYSQYGLSVKKTGRNEIGGVGSTKEGCSRAMTSGCLDA